MPDTVSNNGRLIVNQGSSADGVATAPDTDKVPAAIPVPFPNVAPASTMGANKTTTTFIGNQPIATMGTHIGPQSNPGHPGVNKGVGSGTYREYANPTSWSGDLFLEGKGALRSLDTTLQNQGNTMGLIMYAAQSGDASNVEKADKYKCSIVSLETVGGKRQLGWQDRRAWHRGQKEGEPRYIEILDNDIISLKSTRKDVTKDPQVENPDCGKPHTDWVATITTYPFRRKVEKRLEGSEFKLIVGADAIDDAVRWAAAVKKVINVQIKEDGVKEWAQQFGWPEDAGKKILGDRLGGMMDNIDSKPQTLGSAHADQWKWGRRSAHGAPLMPAVVEGKTDEAVYKKEHTARQVGANVSTNLTTFIKLMYWSLMPPVIDVKATGCSGSKTATIMVYPSRKFEFKFSIGKTTQTKRGIRDREDLSKANRDKQIDAIVETIKKAKLAAYVCEKFFRLGGSDLNTQIAMDLEVKGLLQYKHNDKLHKGQNYRLSTPASVGLDWQIDITVTPIKAGAQIGFSLWKFIPYIGPLAEKLLNKLGVRAEIYFRCDITSSLNGGFGFDEYGDFKKDVKIRTKIEIEPFAGVRVGYFSNRQRYSRGQKKAAEAAGLIAEFGFPAYARLDFILANKPGKLITVEPLFVMKTGFKMTVKVWRWFHWKAVPYTEPKSWQIQYPRKNAKKIEWILVAGPS